MRHRARGGHQPNLDQPETISGVGVARVVDGLLGCSAGQHAMPGKGHHSAVESSEVFTSFSSFLAVPVDVPRRGIKPIP